MHRHTRSAFCCFTNLSIKTLPSPDWLEYLLVNKNILDMVKWAVKPELLRVLLCNISLLKTTSNSWKELYIFTSLMLLPLYFYKKISIENIGKKIFCGSKTNDKNLNFCHFSKDNSNSHSYRHYIRESKLILNEDTQNIENLFFFNEVVHTDNYIRSLNKLFKCTAGIFIKRNF